LPNPKFHAHTTCFLFALLRSYTKSVITKPQNVMVLRDIMCNGYVAGGNCHFFGTGGKKLTAANPLTGDKVRQAIADRLAYTDDLDATYDSMLAFLSPYDEIEAGSRDQVISISDRLLPWEVTRAPGTDKQQSGFPGGQAGYAHYRGKYSLDSVHYGEDVRAAENMEFIANGSMNNSTCILGPHRKYSPYSQNFYELCPGQGHFGPGMQHLFQTQSTSTQHSHNANQLLTKCQFDSLALQTPFREMPAGAVARRCRSSRRATRWCRSRWRRTRSSPSARPTPSK
jgi:hypothetical protein